MLSKYNTMLKIKAKKWKFQIANYPSEHLFLCVYPNIKGLGKHTTEEKRSKTSKFSLKISQNYFLT